MLSPASRVFAPSADAVVVGVMQALTPADAVVATYRAHGQALARGVPASTIMAEMYGKQEGCSRGRGKSMHLFDASTRFYGGNAIVGSALPVAVGLALADTTCRRRPRYDRSPTQRDYFQGAGADRAGGGPQHSWPQKNIRATLDIDSFDRLNFRIGLNAETGAEIPEGDYGQLTTLADIINYLAARLR